MAYAQWVVLRIINSFRKGNIKVQNARVNWGKFHKNGSKDEELAADKINSIVIAPGANADVSSCGRSDAASGTEGSLDLYEDDTKICTIYWTCPWGSKDNNIQIQERNSQAGYMVSVGAFNANSGALGSVDVEVAKKG